MYLYTNDIPILHYISLYTPY